MEYDGVIFSGPNDGLHLRSDCPRIRVPTPANLPSVVMRNEDMPLPTSGSWEDITYYFHPYAPYSYGEHTVKKGRWVPHGVAVLVE